MRVSKLWQRLSVSFAKAWSHLDLSIARRKVTPTEIRAYLRRFHSVLTHVTLANVKENKLPEIVEFLSRCPKLTSCEALRLDFNMKAVFVPFNRMTKLTSLIIHPDIQMTPNQFFDILRRCRHLELTVVHLLPVRGGLPPQLPMLPNLKSLTVHTTTRESYVTEPLEFLDDVCYLSKSHLRSPPT